MIEIRRAVVKSYDAASHTAAVQIAGSLAVWLDAVRVATNIPAADVVAGRQCSVLFLDPSNQDEAVVLTIQGALPSGGGGGAPDIQEDAVLVKAAADPIDYRTGFGVDVDGTGVNVRLALDELTFDAIVDGNGNDAGYYATLQAAIDAGSVAILVITDVAGEFITISADSVRLIQGIHQGIAGPTFTSIADPDVTVRIFTFTDEVVDLDADRIRIEDCIFTVTGGGRSGIDVNSSADDCVISRCRWLDNDAASAINIGVGGASLRTRIQDCTFAAAVSGTNCIRLETGAGFTTIEGCLFADCSPTGFVIFMDDGGSSSGGADDTIIRNCIFSAVSNGGINWKGKRGLLSGCAITVDAGNPCVEAHFMPDSAIIGCLFAGSSTPANTIFIEDTNTTTVGLHSKTIVGCSFQENGTNPTYAIKLTGAWAGYWAIVGNGFYSFSGGGATICDVNSKAGVTIVGNTLRGSGPPINLFTDTLVMANGPTSQIKHAGHVLMATDDAYDFANASNQVRYYYGKPVLRGYTDGTRPAAGTVPAGTLIFNTSDNFPNVSDGTNWHDMTGAIT